MQKKSRRPWEKVLSMALMLVMLMLGILCFLTPLSTLVGVQYLAFGCLAIYSVVMVVRYIGSEQIFTSGRSGLFFAQCGGATGVDVPVRRSGGGNDVFYLLYCAGSAVGIYGD